MAFELTPCAALAGCRDVFQVYAIDYRRPPRDPYPAALEDCVRAYIHLVQTLRVSPRDIVVAGDSAGGGLTASSLVMLRDEHPSVALPAGAVSTASSKYLKYPEYKECREYLRLLSTWACFALPGAHVSVG